MKGYVVTVSAAALVAVAASPFGSDPATASIGFTNGKPAGSASPLIWAQAQYLRLVTDLGRGSLGDRPAIVADRYVRPAPPGVLTVTATATATGGQITVSGTAIWTTDRAVLIPAVIISGIFIGVNNTITTQAVMTVSPVEKPVASAAYGFVRFIGGGLAPYAAGRLVLAVNIHFPFYIAVGAIVAGIVILTTAHSLLTQAERVQAEQVTGSASPAAEPASPGPVGALIPVEANTEAARPGARVILAAVDASPVAALVTEAAGVLAADHGGVVHVVHTQEEATAGDVAIDGESLEVARAMVRNHLDRLAAHHVPAEGHILLHAADHGAAGRIIVEYASTVKASTIVIGAPTHGGLPAWMDGSASHELARHARSNVLVVNPDAPAGVPAEDLWRAGQGRLAALVGRSGVVEDQAEGAPVARAHRAHAVPDRARGPAARAAHRPVPGGEDQAVPLLQGDAGAPGLRPRPLLDQEELPAGVVRPVLVEPDHDLQREDQVAEDVAVQGVPVPGLIAQQDLRALALPGLVAHFQPLSQGVGPRGRPAEAAGPVAGDHQQVRVECLAQLPDGFREVVREVPVLAGAEPVPGHVDGAAEQLRLLVEGGQLAACGRGEQAGRAGAAAGVEFGGDGLPVGGDHREFPSRELPSRAPSWTRSCCLRATPPA